MNGKLDSDLQRIIDQCVDAGTAEKNAKKSVPNSEIQRAWALKAQKLKDKKNKKS